jgi:hypothetical protein
MSKLEDLMEQWKKDCAIDQTDLATESMKIPMLHAKYYEYYSKENLLLSKVEHDYRQLLKLKFEYYSGKMSDEEIQEYGWEQIDIKIVRKDIDIYIDADPDVVTMLLKIALQREKVEFLKDVIKSIHNRNFTIRAALDFIKWSSGS